LRLRTKLVAQAALRRRGYSAANEVAVDAFLDGKIAWREIASVIAATLDRHDGAPATDAASVIDADAEARRRAHEELNHLASAVRA